MGPDGGFTATVPARRHLHLHLQGEELAGYGERVRAATVTLTFPRRQRSCTVTLVDGKTKGCARSAGLSLDH